MKELPPRPTAAHSVYLMQWDKRTMEPEAKEALVKFAGKIARGGRQSAELHTDPAVAAAMSKLYRRVSALQQLPPDTNRCTPFSPPAITLSHFYLARGVLWRWCGVGVAKGVADAIYNASPDGAATAATTTTTATTATKGSLPLQVGGVESADGPATKGRRRDGAPAGTPNQHTSLGVMYELVC